MMHVCIVYLLQLNVYNVRYATIIIMIISDDINVTIIMRHRFNVEYYFTHLLEVEENNITPDTLSEHLC